MLAGAGALRMPSASASSATDGFRRSREPATTTTGTSAVPSPARCRIASAPGSRSTSRRRCGTRFRAAKSSSRRVSGEKGDPTILSPAPNYFPADSLFPVFPTPETGKALLLLLGIFLLLLLPKTLIAFASAFGSKRKTFGGALQVLAGATAELAMTSTLAPIMMMFQSKAVGEILVGADSGWPATEREDGSLPLRDSFKASWYMVIAGTALLGATFFYSPNLFLWVCPIAVPLMLSPILISLSGNPQLGDMARRAGLFATPFELDPEPVIRASEAWRKRLEAVLEGHAPTTDGRQASGLAVNPA